MNKLAVYFFVIIGFFATMNFVHADSVATVPDAEKVVFIPTGPNGEMQVSVLTPEAKQKITQSMQVYVSELNAAIIEARNAGKTEQEILAALQEMQALCQVPIGQWIFLKGYAIGLTVGAVSALVGFLLGGLLVDKVLAHVN